MPRYDERDDRIYTRRSHPSHGNEGPRWEPENQRRAPSSFDYREEYEEEGRGDERDQGGGFRSFQNFVGSGDGYNRGPTYNPAARFDRGRFGDLSCYSGSDDYYDHGGERWNPKLARRERGRDHAVYDRQDWRSYGENRGRFGEERESPREREMRARRYEEHQGPGEGMMDLVRGFFGVGPKNYRRSDSRIEEDANEAFYHDRHLDASGIEVSVKDGVVTLNGTVPNRWSKWRAEDLLEDISGVLDVQNRLTLAKDGGYREDESILQWAGGTRENPGARPGLGAQENADSLAGRSIGLLGGSPDDAAAMTGTTAITGQDAGAPAPAEASSSESGQREGAAEEEGTFGSRGLPGTTSTGGFNNTVVVHPVDEEKSA